MRVHKKRDGWLLIADDGTVLRYMGWWEYGLYRLWCSIMRSRNLCRRCGGFCVFDGGVCWPCVTTPLSPEAASRDE